MCRPQHTIRTVPLAALSVDAWTATHVALLAGRSKEATTRSESRTWRGRLASMKRTVTISFELTQYQRNQIKRLGSMLWPGQNLSHSELCRRILLDGVDGKLAGQLPPGERLLEAVCQPRRE